MKIGRQLIISFLELIPRDEPRTELDPFMHQMRSATNASDVFGVIHNRGKTIQLPHLVAAMKILFELQKIGMYGWTLLDRGYVKALQ